VDKLKENITQNIQHFRKKMGISQEELSSLCGYSSTYLGKIERGQRSPSLDTLIRIARALQIPVVSFFDSFYRRQDELKENWTPEEFTPYDAAIRRFNYIVGILTRSGEIKFIFHLPWFQSEDFRSEDYGEKKLWEWFNFSPRLVQAVKNIIKDGNGLKKHFNLKISGCQFQWEPVDFVLFAEEADEIKFELFYPRFVKDGEALLSGELNFELAD